MAGTEKKYSVRMPKIPGEQKTWTFTVTMPGMITAVGSALVALTLFFILGLLVGRGYRPEQNVPPLAQIMPKQEHGALVTNATEPVKVLTAQDLTYPETLTQQPAERPRQEEPQAVTPAQQVKPPKPVPAQAPKEAAKVAAPKTGEKIYDYVYQAASFRKEDMAADLRAKLAGAGLNTAIQTAETSKGTWYRVVVNHRGTPDSTNGMKAVLNRFGIGKPLMKKKTLVGNAQ
ncbi:SPOR domain-containing protein [Salidesulfovibrio onnuriiensis]|uniref:SPOR domain-containing protein n=1 Tax=Salidesulfovibrio onnuriiensis TaxID=2583823 RepID=UPI0011C89C7D|nr:SPOR domain-containing protein [Salidesulfovibrio onnuriiensis]